MPLAKTATPTRMSRTARNPPDRRDGLSGRKTHVHPLWHAQGNSFCAALPNLAPLTDSIRQAALKVDAGVPAYGIETMDQLIAGSLEQSPFNAFLMSVFASVALLLAAVGIYGCFPIRLRNAPTRSESAWLSGHSEETYGGW
jgi:hypothetical protein